MWADPLPDGRIPVLLSAHDEYLIGRDATAILDYLQRRGEPGDHTAAVAATLLRTRRVRRHRALVRAADQSELVAGLRALADGNEHPLVATSSESGRPRTAFVFPGQGTRWPSMGTEAYRHFPAYRAEANRCAQAFAAAALPSPLRYLLSDEDDKWSQIDIQGAQFTHAVSLAEVWRGGGMVPDMTLGHSLGEVAAAYVAGSVELPDAVAVVAARAGVLDRLPGRYGMAVLGVGAAQAEQMMAVTPGWLEVSVINAPTSTVVSGDRDAVAQLVRRAEDDGVFVRMLDVDFPAHTTALQPLHDKLRELLPAAEFSDSPVPFIGSASGAAVPAGTDFADYWWGNLRNTVRFDRAVAAARQHDAAVFVELSAHPALLYALSDLVDDAVVVGSGRRDEPLVEHLSAGIAAAALADPEYRWADTAGLDGHPLLPDFPHAPMRAIHLWAQPEPLPPPPGAALTVAAERWEPSATVRTESCRAVAVLGSGDDPLRRRLTEAVAAYHDADLVDPADAEVVVLVAPPQPDVSVAADEIIQAAQQLNYRRAVGARCRRVWLVTVNAEGVQPGESVRPVQAALTGMHRSVGFEFPDTTFAHLDLPRRDVDAAIARFCVDVLRGTATDVAVRVGAAGPTSYKRTLRECAPPMPDAAPADTFVDDVVVTGGSGVVGLQYARYCIEHGARRVVLLSRKGIDRADLSKLIGRHTVDAYAPACDITDRAAVRATAAEYGGTGASLLVHAAGVARFGSHDQLTDVDWADVFDAKVTGLTNLIDLWPRRECSRITLCSSVSGVWGGYGHAAYSAANRILDVFAAKLRAEAVDCTSVRWGLWPGTAIGDPEVIEGFERAGLIAMDPDAAVSASLRPHTGDPLIFAADFDRLQMLFEAQGTTAGFVTRAVSDNADPVGDGDASGQRSAAELVRAELAATLSLSGPNSVDLSAALIDLGVDSLLALDLRKRLRRGTGHSVPLAKLLGGITGVELIEALQGLGRPRD
jgi:mycobactin polyketide synthetase MbtD